MLQCSVDWQQIFREDGRKIVVWLKHMMLHRRHHHRRRSHTTWRDTINMSSSSLSSSSSYAVHTVTAANNIGMDEVNGWKWNGMFLSRDLSLLEDI